MKVLNSLFQLVFIMELSYFINAGKNPCVTVLETKSKKYTLCNEEADPNHAEKLCSSQNTRLLTIENLDENQMITKKLREKGISSIWLSSIMISNITNQNGYMWCSTHQQLNFTNFEQSQVTGQLGERKLCPCDCPSIPPPPPVKKPICSRPKCTVTNPLTACRHIQPQFCTITQPPVCTSKRGNCNVECDAAKCEIIQPKCTINTSKPICYINPVQEKCKTTSPQCRITPGSCYPKRDECKTVYEDTCKITTRPCTNKCSQQNCESVTPPCTEIPERCETPKNNSCIPSSCPENRKKRDADGSLRCPPIRGCLPPTPKCFPATTHCPPAVTTCAKPFVDCSPDYCQSTVQICNPPKVICPPVHIICEPPTVQCDDAEASCPQPKVICDNPEIKCSKPIVKCPDPVVNCDPTVTTCKQASYSCSNAEGDCDEEPSITCEAPVVCPVQNDSDIEEEKQRLDYPIGKQIGVEKSEISCGVCCESLTRFGRDTSKNQEIEEVKLCIAIKKDLEFSWGTEDCSLKHKFLCEERF